MTISSTSRVAGPFTGTGAAAVLPFTFAAVDAASVKVYREDGALLTLTTDYTVTLNSDQTASPGGSVSVLAAAYASGFDFFVTTETARTQGRPFATQEGLNLKSVEAALDKLTIVQQEHDVSLDRAVQFPVGETALTLPAASAREGKVLGFGVGGVPVMQNPGGADSSLRSDLVTPGTGPYIISLRDGKSLDDIDQALRVGTIYASLYSTLAAALAAWGAAGGRLLLNRDYLDQLTGENQVNVGGDKVYFLDVDRARGIRYTGADAQYGVIRLLATGPATVIVSPDLTIDGNYKARMPLWCQWELITNPADFRDARIGGTYKNARMLSGNQSAIGLKIDGGFNKLRVEDCNIYDVGRAVGTGTTGSQGSVGIAITTNARAVDVNRFHIEKVDSDEASGSSARADMDGLLIFNRGDTIALDRMEPTNVSNGSMIDCAGRGLKRFAPHSGGVTRDITVRRSVHPGPSGAVDIDHQDGDGVIENCSIQLSGNANGTAGSAMNFGTGVARGAAYPFKPAIARNVTIYDSTGAPKFQICGMAYAAGGTPRRQFRFENIVDHGTAQLWSRPSQLGNYGEVTVQMEQIDVNLTSCLFQTDDSMANMRVYARNFTNRGSIVPYAKNLSGAELQFNWGYAHGENIKGVWRDTGVERSNGAYHCGFSGPGGGVEAPLPSGGWQRLSGQVDTGRVEIAAGATSIGPVTGLLDIGAGVNNGGNYRFLVEFPDRGGFIEGWTTCNNATLNIITAATGVSDTVTVLNTGAAGSSSDIELFKNGVSGGLSIRNGRGAAIYVRRVLNP
jgi:hypothetical protein